MCLNVPVLTGDPQTLAIPDHGTNPWELEQCPLDSVGRSLCQRPSVPVAWSVIRNAKVRSYVRSCQAVCPAWVPHEWPFSGPSAEGAHESQEPIGRSLLGTADGRMSCPALRNPCGRQVWFSLADEVTRAPRFAGSELRLWLQALTRLTALLQTQGYSGLLD